MAPKKRNKKKQKQAAKDRIIGKHRHCKQLFFHVLKDHVRDEDSKLAYRSADKKSVRGEFSEIDLVKSAIRVDISSRMLYDAKEADS